MPPSSFFHFDGGGPLKKVQLACECFFTIKTLVIWSTPVTLHSEYLWLLLLQTTSFESPRHCGPFLLCAENKNGADLNKYL